MELQANLAQFQAKGAQLVTVAVQDVSEANLLANLTKATFPILADVQHQAASAWGVYNVFNDNAAAPAVFIIDEFGHVIWTYIGKNSNDLPLAIKILVQIP